MMFRGKMRFIAFPILAAGFLFLVSYLVMFLWNYTLPAIFGIKTINLSQALALFVLCKVLFGFGKGGPRGGPSWKKRKYGRFEKLSDTEKEEMKARMRGRWCHWDDTKRTAEEPTDGETSEK